MPSDSVHYEFATAGPVDLKVELASGSVVVAAEDVATTTVELEPMHDDLYTREFIARARVEQHGDRIVVLLPKGKSGMFGHQGQVRAAITVPAGSSLRAETGSAGVTGHGRLGEVGVSSGSGDLELEQIASGDFKVGSGDVEVQDVAGSLRLKSGSGDITLGSIGGSGDITSGSGDVAVDKALRALKVKTGSGDVVITSPGERVDVLAGSGDLLVRRIERGEVVAKTGSGDVCIGVAHGTAALLDVRTVTGDFTCHLDATEQPAAGDDTVSVHVMSATGDVILQHA